MSLRHIVVIDEEKCDGCGLCTQACHEGAIRVIDGKARLVKESYCDGLGACLGTCPQDAITVEEREAEDFDPAAVEAAQAAMHGVSEPGEVEREAEAPGGPANWPLQMRLVPTKAPYYQGARLMLVADCVPATLRDYRRRLQDRPTVILGCPKLDDAGLYLEKLTEILASNDIAAVEVLHMVVPCCHGLITLAERAIAASGVDVPLELVEVGVDGREVAPEGPKPAAGGCPFASAPAK